MNSLKAITWKRHPANSVLFPNGTIQVVDYNPPQKPVSPKKLKKLFFILPNLPYAESIIRSARLYALALERIYQDSDTAYQLLTASIETIAKVPYTPTEEDMIKTKSNVADLSIEFGLPKEKANQLEVEACKGMSWTKQKFTRFILENTSGDLWTEDELFKPPDFLVPKKQDFERTISEIYKMRSKASHLGSSYPPSASVVTGPTLPAKALFDIDVTKKSFPPVSWFERVVNMAIQSFIEHEIGIYEKDAKE